MLGSCSTKKNTKAVRLYHAMTTRYNVHFNGNESYKEGVFNMQKDYQDDFTKLVLLDPVSAFTNDKLPQPSGDYKTAKDKSKKAIQLHSITKRPKRNDKKINDPAYRQFLTRSEYNPFIHNAWLLLGKAQYYGGEFLEASVTFAYIAGKFYWLKDVVREARLWQTRSYLELNWLYEAEDTMHKLNLDSIPSKFNHLNAYNYSNYLIRKKEYEKAIPHVVELIDTQKNKYQKVRQKFALAQLYSLTDDNDMAYKTYSEVIKQSQSYRTTFNATIKQTEVMNIKDTEKVVKRLNNMAKQPTNKEYLDQIYYAIGNIYLHQQDTTTAIDYYIKANRESTRNGIDKAVNQITLGNIYFNQRLYTKAQPNYTQAIPKLDASFPDYHTLVKRSKVLDELTIYAQNVELQDSLQQVAKLPESEIMALIEAKIEELKKRDEEMKKEDERAELMAKRDENMNNAMSIPGFSNNASQTNLNLGIASDSWYFYNSNTMSVGKTEFQKRWGTRKLEDNWRRRDKSDFSMSDFDEYDYDDEEGVPDPEGGDKLGKEGDEKGAVDPISDPYSVEYYLQQLPRTPEEFALSDELIIDGLFNMGIILKNQLEDFDASRANFGRLINDFPGNQHLLETYFNIYLMYMIEQNYGMADMYRGYIIREFPETKYALGLSDPNYLSNLGKMAVVQDSIYSSAYQLYLNGENRLVHSEYESFNRKYPLSRIMPKFMLVNALAYVNEGDIDSFKVVLRELLERYPMEDVSTLATSMLKGIASGKKVVSGSVTKNIWEMRLGGSASDEERLSTLDPFTWDISKPHTMMFVFPNDSVDANQLLFAIAKYNFSSFYIKDFDISIQDINNMGILDVSGFSNLKEILQYRSKIEGEDGIEIPDGAKIIMISDDNYRLLMKGYTMDEYLDFWSESLIEFSEDI